MDNVSRDLLKQFVYMDEKIVLFAKDGSFEIPLSITAAKMYSPVIKATLETPIGKDGSEITDTFSSSIAVAKDSKTLYRLPRIQVDGFKHESVQIFVRCLQGQADDNEIKGYNWKNITGLLRMSHFYQVQCLFDLCIEKGKSLIQNDNILEAIELMEMYEFNQTWCDTIVNLLIGNTSCFNKPNWKAAVEDLPNTMSQIQYCFIKRKFGYG